MMNYELNIRVGVKLGYWRSIQYSFVCKTRYSRSSPVWVVPAYKPIWYSECTCRVEWIDA